MNESETTIFIREFLGSRRGLSQRSLAKATGIPQTTISLWARGERAMPVEVAIMLCAVAEATSALAEADVWIDDAPPRLTRVMASGRRMYERLRRRAGAGALKSAVLDAMG